MNFFKHNCKLLYIGFFTAFIGLFILTYSIRQQLIVNFSNRAFLWGINYLAYLGLFLLLLSGTIQLKKDWIFLIVSFAELLLALYTTLQNQDGIGYYIVYSSCCILSVYFIFIKLPDKFRGNMLRWFLFFFNIIILILFFWGTIDHIFGKPIAKWVATFMTYDKRYLDFAYSTYSEGIRFFSFFCHPLVNSTLINSSFAINSIYNKQHKPLIPSFLCCIVAFVSVAFCGTKTGLIVALAIALITFYHKIKLLLSLGVIFIVIILSGLMNNLITRLSNLPLTSGRLTALSALLKDPNYSFHFLYGYGKYMAPEYEPHAFEFPLVTFSFQYGILFALLILGTSFLYVTIKLCKKGSIHIWLLWLLLFAQVNTYTCLAQDLDNSLIFYFLTMVILNIHYDNPVRNNNS